MIISLWRMRSDSQLHVYTVHEEPSPAADRLDRAERLAFLRDGFSWPAALLTPVWLTVRRMWLVLALYFVVIGGLAFALDALGFKSGELGLAIAAIHLVVGYEAYQLERWYYERRGFRLAGTVAGRNKIECERRFFETWLPTQPVITAAGRPSGGAAMPGTLAASAGDMSARRETSREAPEAKPSRWRPFRHRTA